MDNPVESEMSDHEAIMDHCALEAMHALESKDKAAFKDAMGVLITDILMKLQTDHQEA
jgi:hypothetical protein